MSKLKVLFFAADPLSADGGKRRLLLDNEARDIEAEVVAALHRDNVEFKSCWATRITNLRQELLRKRPHVVHFSGHGGSGGLVLESDDGQGPHRVDAEALRHFFSAFRGQIRVVVLNACHSHPQARAIADAVGCAIGTPDRIKDEHAIGFSTAFYSSIAFGQSVQAAFDQACATLRMKGCPATELPQLLVRDGEDASRMVLIADPAPSPLPAPILPTHALAPIAAVTAPVPAETTPKFAFNAPVPPRPSRPFMRRGVVWGVGALTLYGVSLALWASGPDACAPAREVQRSIQATGASPQGLLSAPPRDSGDPTADPPELAEAKRLHAQGDHVGDLPLLEKAAANKNVDAMTLLARAYINGEGVPAQPELGVDLLRRAAQMEDPEAMNELGEAYLRREGVDRYYFRYALNLFQRAADKGHPEAMRNLAGMYRDGRSVDADLRTALEWYLKAARAGFVEAMVDVGGIYQRGGLGAPDGDLAMCWYRAAGELGSPQGMREQGRILESRGKRTEAAELYQRARQADRAAAVGGAAAR